jgi:hypothetical protein
LCSGLIYKEAPSRSAITLLLTKMAATVQQQQAVAEPIPLCFANLELIREAGRVHVPSYHPFDLEPGWFHFGVGDFFRAHLVGRLFNKNLYIVFSV